MSDYLYALLLGLIEGATEFIPVSSTAHLILAERAMNLSGAFWDTFAILIQLGAVLSVVAIYASRFWRIAMDLPTRPEARRFVISVVVAVIPAIVIGLALHNVVKQYLLEDPPLICWSLILGGVALLFIDRLGRSGSVTSGYAVPLPRALAIGVVQCLALIPGVSRSGATISGGLLLGLDKKAAAEFSFFLAIPTMAGAFALDLYKTLKEGPGLTHHQGAVIAIGFVVSFVSGLAVVKWLIDWVSRHGFAPFAYWRIGVGVVGLVALALHH